MLRESITCNADDDLLYTGKLHANVGIDNLVIGNGMSRQCRDWDALLRWADQHSACYALERPGDADFDELDRYKFCPDGSRPWEKIEGE